MSAARFALAIVIPVSAAAAAGPLERLAQPRGPDTGESALLDTGLLADDPVLDEPDDGLADLQLPPLGIELPWDRDDRVRPDELVEQDWAPPDWFPADERERLWELEGMGQGPETVGPRLRLKSRAVFVYDLDADEVLMARAADERRPVASLTKVVSALTLMSEGASLDQELCLDESMMPSWPGAVTRIGAGVCTTGWDLLGAALVRSDNGAALSFPTLAGLAPVAFSARMDAVAHDLGMDQSTFADPTGIRDENLSTARDMTRAIVAASAHPELSAVLDAPYWEVETVEGERVRKLRTTNRLLGSRGRHVFAAKTGYTDTARHCFSAVVQTRDGRRIAMTVMGARWSKWRWRDVERVLRWVERTGR